MQPSPEPVLAPIGTLTQLHCSVSEGSRAEWIIRLPDSTIVSTEQGGVAINFLQGHGIRVQNLSNSSSILTLAIEQATVEVTNIVTCVAINHRDPTLRLQGTQVQVTYFGTVTDINGSMYECN